MIDLYSAKTTEEVEQAIKEQFPDKIKLNDGNMAKYNSKNGKWEYTHSDGKQTIIQL